MRSAILSRFTFTDGNTWFRKALSVVPDFIILAGFVGAAFAIDGDLLTTGDYPSGEWGEWLGHAYRIQVVQEHGLSTWDHAWTGGISLFQTYQFVPHVVTGWSAELAGGSVGRTMLVLEVFLLFWIRCSGYAAARLLGLSRVASLIAGVLTFGSFNYSAEVLSFTTLWGLALVPLLLIAAWRNQDGPQAYVVALFVGLSVYVHPHAAVSGAVALIAVSLSRPPEWKNLSRLTLQGFVVVLATSFYWIPALFSSKPTMQDPASADVDFLRRIFEANVDRVNDLVWLIVPIIMVTIVLFRHTARKPLLRYVVAFLTITLFLVAVSYAGVGTETIRLMQNVRLINLMPLGVGLMGALAADAALRDLPQLGRRGLLVPIGLVLLAAGLFVPMVRFSADRGYEPAEFGPDALGAWFEENNYGQPGRIWLDGAQTPWYTFQSVGELHSARSAFVQGDWSLLARPLQEGILVGNSDWQVTEDYLRAMAVSYILVADHTAAGRGLGPDGPQAGRYEEVLRFETFPPLSLYRMPWAPVVGFVSDADKVPALDFPDTRYANEQDRALRDRLTHEYAELAYSARVTPVKVTYPSPTRMTVVLPRLTAGQDLVVAENWDRAWKAETADGRGVSLERYGPNYIRVDVSELEGNVTIELHHEISNDWKLGIALTLLSVPAAGGLMLWERRRQR